MHRFDYFWMPAKNIGFQDENAFTSMHMCIDRSELQQKANHFLWQRFLQHFMNIEWPLDFVPNLIDMVSLSG